ncbi:DUF4166 domain-containing protein [Bordetella genomosp. 13]|uniref:DUF4166 domain-containing protein n=1 Tax=Bordetella genomosp. 13 TaxID=463040 RepID=UPI0011AB10DE|nr:DUF4166 domain-containing protein [Bordetella genomosp. 13]
MNDPRTTLLIIGGYGTFGGRLARLLADDARLTLVVAGRSLPKAAAFCNALPARARLVPMRFDRDGDVPRQLAGAAAGIVVDATGPFQGYGSDPYRVVRACIDQGIHYLDLADGSGFVHGISAFDAQARSQGVFALSGLSSCPVLTAAVVDALSEGLAHLDAVHAGIAPSPRAGVGLNVIRAIAGYAGRPVSMKRDGRPAVGHALTDAMRYTVAPPGRLPLHSRRFTLVDVPDLQVLPALHPGLRTAWMSAAPAPGLLHRMLSGLAWLVRWKLVRTLEPASPLFHRATRLLRWGEHRGGMFVQLAGRDADGRAVVREWHLLAEGNDGPFIPAMAVAALVRKYLAGIVPPVGARAATGSVSLSDYDTEFAARAIHTGRRERREGDAALPLYRRVLGDAWHALPATLRAMHDIGPGVMASGRATVERGASPLARLLASLYGFPEAAADVPVQVSLQPRGTAEVWRRTFGGKTFSSVQEEGDGPSAHLVTERFGPVAVSLAVLVEDGRLRLVVRRWTLLGIPMPLFLAPGGKAIEYEADGRFHFDVEIAHPWTGRIVRYRGWLTPRESVHVPR